MSTTQSDSIMSFVNDAAFHDLLKDVTDSATDWNSFLDRTIPQGLTANASWELIHTINKNAGTNLPEFLPDKSIFYRHTSQIINDAMQLSRLCLETASQANLASDERSVPLCWSYLHDAIAAARMDGLQIDEQSVYRNWDPVEKVALSSAKTASEQLLFNALALAKNIGDYAQEPLSVSLFEHLSRQMWGDVLPRDLPPRYSIKTPVTPLAVDRLVSKPFGQESPNASVLNHRFQLVADYLEGTACDKTDLGIMRALLSADIMNTYLPLGHIASLMGKIIQEVMFMKQGLRLLGRLPLFCARQRWEQDKELPYRVTFSRGDVADTQRHEHALHMYDITSLHTVSVQMALGEMRNYAAYSNKVTSQGDLLKSVLRESAYFNQRQCSILVRAVRDHNNSFTIRYHQANSGVSYATARRDFQELLDSGCLDCDFSSNTQVFYASEGLEDLLMGILNIDFLKEGEREIAGFFEDYEVPEGVVYRKKSKGSLMFPSH